MSIFCMWRNCSNLTIIYTSVGITILFYPLSSTNVCVCLCLCACARMCVNVCSHTNTRSACACTCVNVHVFMPAFQVYMQTHIRWADFPIQYLVQTHIHISALCWRQQLSVHTSQSVNSSKFPAHSTPPLIIIAQTSNNST